MASKAKSRGEVVPLVVCFALTGSPDNHVHILLSLGRSVATNKYCVPMPSCGPPQGGRCVAPGVHMHAASSARQPAFPTTNNPPLWTIPADDGSMALTPLPLLLANPHEHSAELMDPAESLSPASPQ